MREFDFFPACISTSVFTSILTKSTYLWFLYCFQHDANAVMCDSDLSTQLKSSAYAALKKMTGESQHEVPVLMSGAGHDAMAMARLTKVCLSYTQKYYNSREGKKIKNEA